jgi:hypothetical protein
MPETLRKPAAGDRAVDGPEPTVSRSRRIHTLHPARYSGLYVWALLIIIFGL